MYSKSATMKLENRMIISVVCETYIQI